MIKKIISLVVLVAIGIIGFSFFSNKASAPTDTNSDAVISEEEQVERAVASYLKDEQEDSFKKSRLSFFFCKAHSLWEGNDKDDNKLVYAAHACLSMVPSIDKGVEEESGIGVNAKLFKLKQVGTKWTVIDADDRMFPQDEVEDWVLEYMDEVPQHIIESVGNYDTIYAEIADEAKKHFGLDKLK